MLIIIFSLIIGDLLKNLIIILNLILSFSSFAQEKSAVADLDQNKIINIVDESIGLEETCLDEYLTRESQLKRFLIWAPPATVVGAPITFMAGGYTAAFISSTLFKTGWDALGYTILGAVGAGAATVGTFIGLEISKGIQFFQMRKMTNIIVSSHANLLNSKALYRLNKRYNKKYPEDNITVENLAFAVVMLDERGLLCNGDVRGNLDAKKLKHKLARRKDLIKYIHNYVN